MKSRVFFKFIFLGILVKPLLALSASGEGIPTLFIFFQGLNFSIFVGIIIYFIVKKVPPILKRKHRDYLSMNMKAKEIYQETFQTQQELEGMIREAEGRFKNLKEELEQKVKEVQARVTKETEAWCQAILRGAQSLIDLEEVRLNQNLQNDLLNRMEDLCKSDVQETSENSEMFMSKLLKKSL